MDINKATTDGVAQLDAEELRHLLGAVLSLNTDLDLPALLERITQAAVTLVGARYGALGVIDESGKALAQFVTVGMDKEEVKALGDFPTGKGILNLLITNPEAVRVAVLADHLSSFGFPPGHPHMTSFLGAPIRRRGEVFGNLYLTDKQGEETFSEADESLVRLLADAAAVAVDNARLHTRVQTHVVKEDRERIARDLHDTVIQRLFAAGLSLQAAARTSENAETSTRIDNAISELDNSIRDIRTAVFALHSRYSSQYGLRSDLLTLVNEAHRVLGFAPHLHIDGPIDSAVPDLLSGDVLAVAREALTNVAKHARATSVELLVEVRDSTLFIVVTDNGVGFGLKPKIAGGRGIAGLEERATALGGSFSIGKAVTGTRLTWTAPVFGRA